MVLSITFYTTSEGHSYAVYWQVEMAELYDFNTTLISYSCFDNLSTTEVTTERWTSYSYSSSLATGIILMIWGILGTILCIFITVTIIWNNLYQQPTHIIFLALVFNTAMVCFIFFPISIISAVSGEFIFGSSDATRCQVCQIGVISVFALHTNIFLVAFLSLDRFLFIRFPLHYSRYVTVKSTLILVINLIILCCHLSPSSLWVWRDLIYKAN